MTIDKEIILCDETTKKNCEELRKDIFNSLGEFNRYLDDIINNCCRGAIICNYNNIGTDYKVNKATVKNPDSLLEKGTKWFRSRSQHSTNANNSEIVTINKEIVLVGKTKENFGELRKDTFNSPDERNKYFEDINNCCSGGTFRNHNNVSNKHKITNASAKDADSFTEKYTERLRSLGEPSTSANNLGTVTINKEIIFDGTTEEEY